MISVGAIVTATVRAHYVYSGHVLPAHAYLELAWDPALPLEVRLSGRGQVSGTAVFARDLLRGVLACGAAEPEGAAIGFRLGLPAPRYVPKLLVSLGQPGESAYAIRPDPVARFLRDTYDLIPEGQEPAVLGDDTFAALLSTP